MEKHQTFLLHIKITSDLREPHDYDFGKCIIFLSRRHSLSWKMIKTKIWHKDCLAPVNMSWLETLVILQVQSHYKKMLHPLLSNREITVQSVKVKFYLCNTISYIKSFMIWDHEFLFLFNEAWFLFIPELWQMKRKQTTTYISTNLKSFFSNIT